MQDNSLTEENKEKIEQAKQLLSNNNEDIGDVDKISEFKKLNRKANAMVILSVLTAIVIVYFDCFLISCLLPCEGERCHSCLISFFLFVPIYFFGPLFRFR